MILLSRKDFRSSVLFRDGNKCVICGSGDVVAHHILDRSLFENGGYYIDNGVSLCNIHHKQAESTEISCDQLRTAAHIKTAIIPDYMEIDNYDHWGNIILTNGNRCPGELYYNEKTQKILTNVKHLFIERFKYPKTYHLPWSENINNDDKTHSSISSFLNRRIIVSIKFDGEQSNLYRDYYHARSLTYSHHLSRSWLKNFHASFAHDIPLGWRIVGENLFAEHSIHYNHLQSYFLVFSIWDRARALSWDDTIDYTKLLNLCTVPVIFDGTVYNHKEMKEVLTQAFEEYKNKSKDPVEGYVVRIGDEIPYNKFRSLTAKFVRKEHITTTQNWMQKVVVSNKCE